LTPPSPPELTFIAVTYRAGELMRASLDAALPQLGGWRHEVIVVENGGRDRELEARVQSLPGGRYLSNPENRGFAAAVNQALAASSGELVLVANPDTFLHAGCVAGLIDALRADPDAAAAGPRILNADGSLQGSGRRFPSALTCLFGRTSLLTRVLPGNPWTQREVPALALAERSISAPVDWVSGACLLLRRTDLEAIGGFDEGYFLYWEDADLCRRLATRGRQTLYVPGARATHLVGGSSRHRPGGSVVDFHRSVFRYYRLHTAPRAPAGVTPLVAVGLVARALLRLVQVGLARPLHSRAPDPIPTFVPGCTLGEPEGAP
jgi:GT2 family glycosyltransferase